MVYYLQSKTVDVYGLADYWSVHSCRKVVENTFKVLEFKSQNGITCRPISVILPLGNSTGCVHCATHTESAEKKPVYYYLQRV